MCNSLDNRNIYEASRTLCKSPVNCLSLFMSLRQSRDLIGQWDTVTCVPRRTAGLAFVAQHHSSIGIVHYIPPTCYSILDHFSSYSFCLASVVENSYELWHISFKEVYLAGELCKMFELQRTGQAFLAMNFEV
jgi:hypothetical protein